MTSKRSRYLRTTQRTALTRGNLARVTVAGAMLVLPVACGNGDEAVFSEASASSTPSSVAATTPAATTPTTNPATTSATSLTTAASEATVADSAIGAAFPAGGEMLVSFTYQPSSSGQAKRPYVAVWVEDTDGNLVDTISLWFEQSGKGSRWLDDLRQWWSASDGDDVTMSSATRVPGDYVVAWDGTDAGGEPIAQGDYVLFIEAAREHGPYSLASGAITVSDDGFTLTLDDDGELSAITAELAV